MPLQRILPFLTEIGITVRERALPNATFVPGIFIEAGTLVIDRDKLSYPGDLLHEAGHIAVVPPSGRAALTDDLQSGPGDEMAAIAWSFAAARHIDLDPAIVFHAHGYKGGGPSLCENFCAGRYLGVPLLQWFGMTFERDDGSSRAVYPKMTHWLRPESGATLSTVAQASSQMAAAVAVD